MAHLADASTAVRRRLASMRRIDQVALLALAVATALVTAVYVYAMRRHTGGQLAAPLDDVYIHFNYARHMAAGHLYEYNPGDGVSTGATSLLWTPIVALGYLLGFQGQRIILWSVGLNVLCLLGYGVLLYRLATLLLPSRALAALAATAILLEGRVLWGFFAGMEIGPYHLLSVLVIDSLARFQRDRRPRHRRIWIAATAALVLVRPEGSFLAGFAIVAFALWRVLEARRAPAGWSLRRLARRREWLWVALPLVVWLGQWLVLYVATGQPMPNGLRVKSHLYQPDQTLLGVLKPSLKFYQDMVFDHFPWLFERSLHLLLSLAFLAGALSRSIGELRRRRPGPGFLMTLWFFGGLAIQSVMLNAAYHHGRYQMNYTFIYWLLMIAGLHAALVKLQLGAWIARMVTGGFIAVLLVMMVNTVAIFSQHFGKDCRAIQNQHVAIGRQVAELVPPDAAVGLNDAGAIAYVGGRYVYDVFGLTTNVAARWRHDGQAPLFEQILYLDPTRPPRRPDYFAVYPEWYPAILDLGLLTELARATIPEPNICGANTKALYAVDWGLVGDKHTPQGFRRSFSDEVATIVDHVDIAYRPDEIDHDYRHWRNGQPSEWGSDLLRRQPYVGRTESAPLVDGGREIAEREQLVVRGVDPAVPLLLVRRCDGVAAAARVLVDDREAGLWKATAGHGKGFRDEVHEVAADLLSSSSPTIRFEVVADERAPSDHERAAATYRVYYYWFAQPTR
ncbi:MAG: hypothetical protein JRI23_06080 [Deltaproteobacteria bacterium]|jgi:hypothetical protein|nr:hypothetical protein [Deltaproteobacteria bacterium]MBW2531136.1 hypothetical protein [Deltaproteobacteria bacterium]